MRLWVGLGMCGHDPGQGVQRLDGERLSAEVLKAGDRRWQSPLSDDGVDVATADHQESG